MPAPEPRLVEPKVRRVIVNLCEPCIKGEGEECHTPGCVLFLHSVDLPITEELLENAEKYTALQAALTAAEANEALTRGEEEQATLEANNLRRERAALQQRVEVLVEMQRSLVCIAPHPNDAAHTLGCQCECLICQKREAALRGGSDTIINWIETGDPDRGITKRGWRTG